MTAILIAANSTSVLGQSANPAMQKPVVFSQTSDGGMLFINGERVFGPYRISATETCLFVNEMLFQSPLEYPGEDELDLTSVQEAMRLADELNTKDGIVVSFHGTSPIYLNLGSSAYAFYETLLQRSAERQLSPELFASIPSAEARGKLQSWLLSFQPTLSLQADVKERKNRIDSVVAEGQRAAAALVRKDLLAYPLTLIAMMLGVVALGHMLKWTAHCIILNQGDTISEESIRGAKVALLLMVGMSAVDLVWTILAGQAGAMREVNPLAAGLIGSPMLLAVFKITATSLGFAVLYALRAQRRGQEVTWWMCLVCVLVTFRWVMFDSMVA